MHYEPWSFCIFTFGCKVNQYESQSVREAWRRMSGVETDAPAEADVILLNTCAVTANAVTDARQAVRRLQREAPGVPIVIAGCAAEVARRELSALPGVLRVLEQDHKSRLLDAPPLAQFAPLATEEIPETPFPSTPDEARARAATRERSFPPFHIDGFRRARPVLKVQDGCSHGCAYCIVPLTRGPARSRDPKECLAELRRLLEAGYREIMISGINLRQYAMRDAGCRDFWELLRYLDRELAPEWGSGARPDPARLRISSVEPAQLTERGIGVLAETRMVCPHLHLSLQSGSADVLKAMRRGHYTPEGLLEAVGAVRARRGHPDGLPRRNGSERFGDAGSRAGPAADLRPRLPLFRAPRYRGGGVAGADRKGGTAGACGARPGDHRSQTRGVLESVPRRRSARGAGLQR